MEKILQLANWLKKQNREITLPKKFINGKESIYRFIDKNKRSVFLTLIFITVFFFLLNLHLVNLSIKKQIVVKSIITSSVAVPPIALYPVINSVAGVYTSRFTGTESKPEVSTGIDISARGAIIMDDSSKVILFAKNEDKKFSMASTVKIMTAITSLEYYKMDDVLTIERTGVEGSVMGFKKGERMFYKDLLYSMLLPSANDAAFAIADNYPGGEKEFVKKMNGNAKFFRLDKTHFSDPTGLDDGGDYTTVIDLARLSSIALKNKTIATVVATKNKTVSNVSGTKDYSLKNLNKLLGTYGVTGIKTGFTDEAGGILASSKIENGRTLIIVVMKSEDRFLDTEKLLYLVSGNITYLSIRP